MYTSAVTSFSFYLVLIQQVVLVAFEDVGLSLVVLLAVVEI